MLRLLSAPPASVSVPEEDRALLLLPQSLGRIASRGDPRALEALLEMTAAGSNGGTIAVAAQHSSQAANLRDDLLEMAVRGLALAGDARASARLRALAAGAVRPAATGRDLSPSAAEGTGRPGPSLRDASVTASPREGPLKLQVDALFDSPRTIVKKRRSRSPTIPTCPIR